MARIRMFQLGAKNRLTLQRLKQVPDLKKPREIWLDGVSDRFSYPMFGYIQGIDSYLEDHKILLLNYDGMLTKCALTHTEQVGLSEVSREYCLEFGACLYWPDDEGAPFTSEWIEAEKDNQEFWIRFQDARFKAIEELEQIYV